MDKTLNLLKTLNIPGSDITREKPLPVQKIRVSFWWWVPRVFSDLWTGESGEDVGDGYFCGFTVCAELPVSLFPPSGTYTTNWSVSFDLADPGFPTSTLTDPVVTG